MEIFSNIEFNESTEVLENTIDTLLSSNFTDNQFCEFSGLSPEMINEDETAQGWKECLLEELNSVIYQRTGDYYFYNKQVN